MPKLAMVATIEVTPGRREEFLRLLMAHKARCLKDEPGTLQFEVLVPHDENSKLLLYQVYQDDAAFETHLTIYHTLARRGRRYGCGRSTYEVRTR